MSTDPQTAPDALSSEACWGVLERTAASPSLKRAARLREFLLYVGTKSLREGRSDIHEQEIGHEVFGRHEAYDTSQDNIVRVSATELRKRVEAYFANEGRDEPLVFEIPRGSYSPHFRLRASEAAAAQPAPAAGSPANAEPAVAATVPFRPSRRLLWIVSAIAVLLAVACLLLWRQNQLLKRHIHFLENPHPAAVVQPHGLAAQS